MSDSENDSDGRGVQSVHQGPGGQQEMPFAMVEGKPVSELPVDLYIPPDALEIILEAFEGPLDLLLYLIRRQNLDILDIQVAEITRQYMEYIDLMHELQLELAAEYLVMAAVLAEIKSRMLLPRHEEEEEEEEDPRAELIRRLQEYERFKQAAEDLDLLARENRDFWIARGDAPERVREMPLPEVDLQEMLVALSQALARAERFAAHHVRLDPLSTRERMSQVLERLSATGDQMVPFVALFSADEGRAGVVVTFNAILQLLRERLVEVVQVDTFGPIHIKSVQ